MREECCMFQVKRDGKYVDAWRCDDILTMYDFLVHDMIAKKLNECKYITRITRKNNYDGTQDITVYYENNCRRIYTVKII